MLIFIEKRFQMSGKLGKKYQKLSKYCEEFIMESLNETKSNLKL